jgi:hypothetical protein
MFKTRCVGDRPPHPNPFPPENGAREEKTRVNSLAQLGERGGSLISSHKDR